MSFYHVFVNHKLRHFIIGYINIRSLMIFPSLKILMNHEPKIKYFYLLVKKKQLVFSLFITHK